MVRHGFINIKSINMTYYLRALNAYLNECKKNGHIPMQPNEDLSTVGRKYVYLNNVNGLIAKYNFKTGVFV